MYAIVATLLILIASTNANVHFQPVPHSTPVLCTKLALAHVSYDNYAMIYHVNLAEFYKLEKTIQNTLFFANETCHQPGALETCSTVVTQLQSQFFHAQRDNENLKTMRQRRGLCNWCGSVQGFLYGTLDHRKGEQILRELNENRNETVILHNTILNQTALFQTSLKMNNENFHQIDENYKKLHNAVTESRKTTNEYKLRVDTELRSFALNQLAEMMLNEHFRLYMQISRAISDAKNHRVPELIPTEVFSRDLKLISSTLKRNQRQTCQVAPSGS